MATRLSREERAERAEAKALWARADVEAAKREEVDVLLKAVRGMDRVIAFDEGSATDVVGRAMVSARVACAASLKILGVQLP